MKTIVIKCNLSEADFIVSNIIPVEKSTRDLEIILPVEIDDTISDAFKFLTERKDIVKEWKFLEELEEEVREGVKEMQETMEETAEEESQKKEMESIDSKTYILNNPFELDKFIVVFCKLFSSKPSLRPFSSLWDLEFRSIYGENRFSYGEENLRKCAQILEIWDREEYPLLKIGTEIRKWLMEVGRDGDTVDPVGYVIDKLLNYLKK